MEKQQSYKLALEIAINNLKKLPFNELLDKIKYSGATITESKDNFVKFQIQFFNDIFTIAYPEFTFSKESGGVISLVSKIIVLHYLENITPYIKITENLVSYKHIPGAFNYYPVFCKKVTTPLIMKYNSLDKFKKIFDKMNVNPVNLGDSAFKVKTLPQIDIFVLFWDGDEEFPHNIDFLFDETIKELLSLEDIVVISQMLSKRLLFL